MFNDDRSTSEYLKTFKGQLNRHNWRQMSGRTYYSFHNEPLGKNTKRINKINFQRDVLYQLKKSNRRAYKSRIVAEIDLNPTSKTPPHIHIAARELINLFEKPMRESGIKRKGLIYQNDKQIAYLAVRYQIGASKEEIHAKFAPQRDFFQDLKLAYKVSIGEYDNFTNTYDLEQEIVELEGDRDKYGFSDAIKKLRELERDKDFYIRMLSRKAYKSMLLLDKIEAQIALLNMSKLTVRDVYNVLKKSEIFEERSNLMNISKVVGDWVTNSPVKMQLPDIPIRNNQTGIYKEKIRKCLNKFKVKFDILYPLYIPVVLEIIYKPPLASKFFYKDLDNIMRWVIPIFHDEFKPPPSHLSMLDPDNIDGDDLKIKIKSLPKSVKYSVSGFEIIEIPRHHNDKSDGYVVIGISPGSFASNSIWGRINEIIRKAEEIYDRYY